MSGTRRSAPRAGTQHGGSGTQEAMAPRPKAVQLYVAGAHRPALDALETVHPEIGPTTRSTSSRPMSPCWASRGCAARVRAALEHCGRQLHRTVLRGLAMDVDQPFLALARRSIADKLGAGAFEPALREAWAMMARIRRPEAALVDLAQIHLDSVVPRVEQCTTTCRLQQGQTWTAVVVRWPRRTRSVPTSSEPPARPSCPDTHEPSRRKAELILRKADGLEERAALARCSAAPEPCSERGTSPRRCTFLMPPERPERASRA